MLTEYSAKDYFQVHQQNNNLNMNQNIVNQLNIDLPPPVPGKRSVEEEDDKVRAEGGPWGEC